MPIGKEDDAPGPIDMPRGNAREVLAVFLRLGLTSFGGPIAHLGYFRDEFVVRRRWLDEKTYADLVALCQFLPGPASSQVGIAIGLSRAGYLGALAAWLGFTLPSAVALVLFAYGVEAFGERSAAAGCTGSRSSPSRSWRRPCSAMMRSLAPDRERATLAVVAAALVLAVPVRLGPDRRHRARRRRRPRRAARRRRRPSTCTLPHRRQPATLGSSRSRCSSRC